MDEHANNHSNRTCWLLATVPLERLANPTEIHKDGLAVRSSIPDTLREFQGRKRPSKAGSDRAVQLDDPARKWIGRRRRWVLPLRGETRESHQDHDAQESRHDLMVLLIDRTIKCA